MLKGSVKRFFNSTMCCYMVLAFIAVVLFGFGFSFKESEHNAKIDTIKDRVQLYVAAEDLDSNPLSKNIVGLGLSPQPQSTTVIEPLADNENGGYLVQIQQLSANDYVVSRTYRVTTDGCTDGFNDYSSGVSLIDASIFPPGNIVDYLDESYFRDCFYEYISSLSDVSEVKNSNNAIDVDILTSLLINPPETVFYYCDGSPYARASKNPTDAEAIYVVCNPDTNFSIELKVQFNWSGNALNVKSITAQNASDAQVSVTDAETYPLLLSTPNTESQVQ